MNKKEHYKSLLARKVQLDSEIPFLYERHRALEKERSDIEKEIADSENLYLIWMAEPSSELEHNTYLKTIRAYDMLDAIQKYLDLIKDNKELGNREAFAFFEVDGESTEITHFFYNKATKVFHF